MDPVVDGAVRAGLALLFLSAATHKLRDVRRFLATVAAYELLPGAVTPLAAGVLIAGEAAVAGSLVVPGLRTPALVGAAGLLALYAIAIAVNLVRGRRIDCGCLGPAARRPISGWLVARNVALAAVALADLVPVRTRLLGWIDAVTAAGATAVAAAVYLSLDGLIANAPALARLRIRA